MKTVQLSRGKEALVDDEDYERVSAFKWHAVLSAHRDAWAAARNVSTPKGQKKIKMHRFIMNAPDGLQVDHKNSDGLDNRRENLRVATNAQNQRNRRIGRNNTSGYKGVTYNPATPQKAKYIARIFRGGVATHVGAFHTAEEAARAYDAKAREVYGEFARVNFP